MSKELLLSLELIKEMNTNINRAKLVNTDLADNNEKLKHRYFSIINI